MRARFLIALALITLATSTTAFAGDDYRDSDYASQDEQNFQDSYGRTANQFDQSWFESWYGETLNHYPAQLLAQAEDPTHPSTGMGMLPLWNNNEASFWNAYRDRKAAGLVQDIRFRVRTGAVVRGHVWRPDATGVYPAIELTPGSVQATEQSYWWAAEFLSASGYIVLTFDAQGQGTSETFGHNDDIAESPNANGVPFQQDVNFLDATTDAVDFMLSSPDRHSRNAFARDASECSLTGEDCINTFNPYASQIQWLDDTHANLGIVGHSYGAQGVSYAQDPAHNTWNVDQIRAVVAWDNVDSQYTPHVPTMGQNAESFVFPSFNPQRPDPESKKDGFDKWRAAGVDTMQIAPRAATHMEWSYMPPSSASSWGNAIGSFYTLAWFDKYLKRDPTADARLLTNGLNQPNNQACDGRANCYSIYYKSAYWFHDDGGTLHSCDDIAHIAVLTACPETDPS